jgi:hypothetical protein
MNIIVSIRKRPRCLVVGNRFNTCDQEKFKPYLITAQSGPLLQAWSMPPREIDVHSSDAHIDMFPIYVADDNENHYHAFQKNEQKKYVEHLTSKYLGGPYVYVQDNNFAGWGHMEGPAVTRNRDGNGWIL